MVLNRGGESDQWRVGRSALLIPQAALGATALSADDDESRGFDGKIS